MFKKIFLKEIERSYLNVNLNCNWGFRDEWLRINYPLERTCSLLPSLQQIKSLFALLSFVSWNTTMDSTGRSFEITKKPFLYFESRKRGKWSPCHGASLLYTGTTKMRALASPPRTFCSGRHHLLPLQLAVGTASGPGVAACLCLDFCLSLPPIDRNAACMLHAAVCRNPARFMVSVAQHV